MYYCDWIITRRPCFFKYSQIPLRRTVLRPVIMESSAAILCQSKTVQLRVSLIFCTFPTCLVSSQCVKSLLIFTEIIRINLLQNIILSDIYCNVQHIYNPISARGGTNYNDWFSRPNLPHLSYVVYIYGVLLESNMSRQSRTNKLKVLFCN